VIGGEEQRSQEEKQRLAIAERYSRTLQFCPDEPTSHWMHRTESLLLRLRRLMKEDNVVIAHRLSTIRRADEYL